MAVAQINLDQAVSQTRDHNNSPMAVNTKEDYVACLNVSSVSASRSINQFQRKKLKACNECRRRRS